MKKLILSFIAILGLAGGAFAQSEILNNPDNRAYFGIRVSPEVTCPGNINMSPLSIDAFNNGGGLEFGGIYNVPVIANFYLEPGVKLYYNAYGLKKEFVKALEDDVPFKSISIRKFGMRIPVLAGYHFDFTPEWKVYAYTGPEFDIAFSGKEHYKGSNFTASVNLYGDEGEMHRFDMSWIIGGGVSYKSFYFGISGGIGMCDMAKDEPSFHENRVTFSLGVNF